MDMRTTETNPATDPSAAGPDDGGQKIREGIEFFEKMLEVIPDDRTALEFLCMAYEQVGDTEKQSRALIKMATLLLKEDDREAALRVADQLELSDSPDARAAVLNIRARCAPPSMAHARPPSEQAVADAVKMELELVQMLERRKGIDEATAKGLREMLESLTKQRGTFLVSALALLEHEFPDAAEKAACTVADAASAPPLPMAIFQPQADLLARLPRLLVCVNGVFPFAEMGGVPLVALANPYDRDLRARVEGLLGSECRFYLALPRDIEDVLSNLPPEEEETAEASA